jgi:hypothetical protein
MLLVHYENMQGDLSDRLRLGNERPLISYPALVPADGKRPIG